MILSFVDKLNEWIEPFRTWIENNHNNPFLWAGLVLVGLAIFAITYDGSISSSVGQTKN